MKFFFIYYYIYHGSLICFYLFYKKNADHIHKVKSSSTNVPACNVEIDDEEDVDEKSIL